MSFSKVNSRYDGPALEQHILDFWRTENVFARTLEQSADRPLFTFNEGPPTANGKPGIHHVLARSFKDIYPRFKTMRGFHAPEKQDGIHTVCRLSMRSKKNWASSTKKKSRNKLV